MKKTKKISKAARERVYMVRTALVLVSIAMLFAIGGGILSMKNQMSTRTYTSEFMKIEIEYPMSYTLEENNSLITLESSSIRGEKITLRKYGSMFTDAKSHVDASLARQKEIPLVRREVSNSNVDGVLGELVEYKTNGVPHRVYYFVKNFALYQFEANDPSLFSDLDAIAKSFRILE